MGTFPGLSRLIGIAALLCGGIASPAVADLAAGGSQRWADSIIGLPVQTADGQPAGEVADIEIGPNDTATALLIDGTGPDQAVPWSGVKIDLSRVILDRDARPQPDYNGPGVNGWRVNRLMGAPARLASDTDWGTVVDLLIGPQGQVKTVLVSNPEGRRVMVPAETVRVGANAQAVDITLPEAQVASLPSPNPGGSYGDTRPLEQTPDKLASPGQEQLKDQLMGEVRAWEKRANHLMAKARSEGRDLAGPERVDRASETLKQQWEAMRQTQGKQFEETYKGYQAALQSLQHEWRNASR